MGENQTIARGQLTIANLYDGKTTQISLSCTHPSTQFYSRVTKRYVPDYAENHVVITPELYFSNNMENQAKNIVHINWTINGQKPEEFGGTVLAAYPYTLTIAKNIENTNQLYVDCQCVVSDPDTLLETRSSAHLCFTKKEELAITPVMLIDYPSGHVFKNDIFDELSAVSRLMVGSIDVTEFAKYTWYAFQNGRYIKLLDNPVQYGQGTSTIHIAHSVVKSRLQLKCVAEYQDTMYSDYITFVSQQDPYTIQVESLNGDMHNGEGTVLCEAHVYQGGKMIADDIADNMFEFSWVKHKRATGEADLGWRSRIGRKLELTYKDIEKLSTFVCEIKRKNDAFPYTLPFNLA